MRLRVGHGGNKSADTSGNSYGDHQNVVNHQSSGRKEAGRDAEILASDSVRSTATGVCLDRLTVGEIDDAEQQDRKSTRLNSSHGYISYAVFCLKKKKNNIDHVIDYISSLF